MPSEEMSAEDFDAALQQLLDGPADGERGGDSDEPGAPGA
jgi:hypothetical protein